MGIIYMAKNRQNGKMYVGQTRTSLRHRMSGHWLAAAQGSSQVFHRALRVYGVGGFEWSVLFDGVSDDDLDMFEIDAIQAYRTLLPIGYNATEGGCSGGGHCEETKRKISEANKGKSSRGYGWRHSEATKKKMAKAALGRSPAVRKRMSEAQKNSKVKKKPSEQFTFKGKRHTEKSKELMRQRALEVQNEFEVKRRKSIAIRVALAARTDQEKEETRKRRIEAQNRPEVKKKKSIAIREALAKKKSEKKGG